MGADAGRRRAAMGMERLLLGIVVALIVATVVFWVVSDAGLVETLLFAGVFGLVYAVVHYAIGRDTS